MACFASAPCGLPIAIVVSALNDEQGIYMSNVTYEDREAWGKRSLSDVEHGFFEKETHKLKRTKKVNVDMKDEESYAHFYSHPEFAGIVCEIADDMIGQKVPVKFSLQCKSGELALVVGEVVKEVLNALVDANGKRIANANVFNMKRCVGSDEMHEKLAAALIWFDSPWMLLPGATVTNSTSFIGYGISVMRPEGKKTFDTLHTWARERSNSLSAAVKDEEDDKTAVQSTEAFFSHVLILIGEVLMLMHCWFATFFDFLIVYLCVFTCRCSVDSRGGR